MLPQQAQEVEAGDGGDAACVAGIAELIEEGCVDPPVVEAVPGCPDDRRDALAQKVQCGGPVRLIRDIDVVGPRRLDRGSFDVGVDRGAEALVEEAVRELEVPRQVAGAFDGEVERAFELAQEVLVSAERSGSPLGTGVRPLRRG